MMALVKATVAAALFAAGLFVFVANFSTSSSSYVCSGKSAVSGFSLPQTVYIKLEEARWWVGLWSDSHGSLYLEQPNVLVRHYFPLVKLGEQIQIRESDGSLAGNFSLLSRRLALQMPNGFFDGTCTMLD